MNFFQNTKRQAMLVLTAGLLQTGFFSTPAIAHIPAAPQSQPIALQGGDVYLSDGHIIHAGTLLFDQGKIQAVGKQVELPEGTRIIDVTGKQLHPGFVLSRTSLGLMEIGRIQESTDISEPGYINPNVRVQVAFHPESAHIPVAAVHGVTTIVPTPTGGIISGQPAAMMSDGWTWEQMVLRAPLGLVINWPSTSNTEHYARMLGELQGAFDQARRYLIARENRLTPVPVDIKWESMIPVLNRELPVFINANELAHIQAAVAWAEKEQLKMVLTGGRDAGYVAEMLARKKIPVMIGQVISGPSRQWEGYDAGYRLPAVLHEAGVFFSIAGEAGVAAAYRLNHSAAAAVAFGLPWEEAMRSVTINAAMILGIDDLVGSLEPGKDATIMVTSGNPLELWSKTEMVFIQGREVNMTDKHRMLYEKYQEKVNREQGE